ncbi:hypothetical protein Cfor_07347 [Coptotermes formosanus]|uniref:Folliculin n=1 Tax=Coptotermes formosanus TaxID=36987 RepID=A0A6L2PJP5_COPFO|nr:hypothetical protein Cfor_07347 [Coptotermes formosanus]
MNAVISLCHFCELHGPSVLFVTQAFHEPHDPAAEPDVQQPKMCYGSASGRCRALSTNMPVSCEACQSLDPKQKFLCNDHEGRISYLSAQQAIQHDVAALVRQACIRSLSCEVYECEQAECPQRALRLRAAHTSSDGKHQQQRMSRSLVELTADKEVFPWLHLKFTWLLKAGADRLAEKIVEGLPTPNLYNHQDTEEGFTLVTAKQVHSPVLELEASASHDANPLAPVIHNVRHLREILGPTAFLSLAYSLMVGRQLILRGKPSGLIASIASCLTVLVPRSCYRAVLNSDQYLDVSYCNILGVEPQVAVPQPSPDVLRLDVLQSDDHADQSDVKKYIYKITWADKLPRKCPTLLLAMEKAIENTKLNDSAMHYHFIALKQEWLGIAKVVQHVQQWNPGQPQDVTSLLQAMGAQEQDQGLLEFWGASAAYSEH